MIRIGLAVLDLAGTHAHQSVRGAEVHQPGEDKHRADDRGDYAGDLLYETLLKQGLAEGDYGKHPDDGLVLKNVRITNAVRCVPPENKPTTEEMNTCRPFLIEEIGAMKNLTTILSLGLISHNAVLKTFGKKLSAHKFAHGAKHNLGQGLALLDSYHCSRYNTQTGRLTADMFEDVFKKI